MLNPLLEQRICKLIAISFALDFDFVWMAYQKLYSFDVLLEKISKNELRVELPCDLKRET